MNYLYQCLNCKTIASVREEDLKVTLVGKAKNPDGKLVPLYEANYYCPCCHEPMVICQWEENNNPTVEPKDSKWGFEKLEGDVKCGYEIVE